MFKTHVINQDKFVFVVELKAYFKQNILNITTQLKFLCFSKSGFIIIMSNIEV